MLALAAARLGLRTHIYSPPGDDAPAFQVCAARSEASFEDRSALEAFAKSCAVATFEWENVPVAAVEAVAALAPVYPDAATLRVTQDRFEEKSFVSGLGLKTAPFRNVLSREDARAAANALGGPAILKTRRMGYDGKGQAKIAGPGEAEAAWARCGGAPCILEAFVPFAFEISVVAARGLDGSFAAYDPPENIHGEHILRRSIAPSRMSAAQCAEAVATTKTIAESLGYVGVLAVEFFVMPDGALLVNEIAPRVHNSGHWTIDACIVSQFENHIRAVAGWPLGSSQRHSDAVMDNLIGADAADWPSLAAAGGALHLYGKREIRPGRKMGHVTRLSPPKSRS
jgi:5-(carboxyamino)imidazole ribonucleotide synthase